MLEDFETVCFQLFKPKSNGDTATVFDPLEQFDPQAKEPADIARSLNAAFLIVVAGRKHPAFERAQTYLHQSLKSQQWSDIAGFYISACKKIRKEIQSACNHDHDLARRLQHLAAWLQNSRPHKNDAELREKIWSVFFPEAVGLYMQPQQAVDALRQKRIVTLTRLHPEPIRDPAAEILFTSNVLLTLPHETQPLDQLPLSTNLKKKLTKIITEPQKYWYDHPIQIGVEPRHNELLYGLTHLATALDFERQRGTAAADSRLTCILSVSVTHDGLKDIARAYIKETLSRIDLKQRADVFMFTETDCRHLVERVLAPAAEHFLGQNDAEEQLAMFGVDGEYGRHYSFLKAIGALWQVLVQPQLKGTFKIDLDQIFPQKVLIEQTGASALQHLMTPLWGACGTTARGQSIELGMIAGALVNESDIDRSLFSPDVRIPQSRLSADEQFFFSVLPQAVSTEAEMMTRYTTAQPDGTKKCIERVHVTGGTNGIRIDSLRKHRPFTPSFIGRAEDQAYLLSALSNPSTRLAYVHKDGLIMRHDKEAFAQEAIRSAEIGRIVGDYIRILNFSAYANALTDDLTEIKAVLDPFTGCFISTIPTTVACLRFSLKAAALLGSGRNQEGLALITTGSQRISNALQFISGDNSSLKKQYQKERNGWHLYYDILDALETADKKQDSFAASMKQNTETIIRQCAVSNA